MNPQYNRHHTLYPRSQYNRYEISSTLRNDPAMVHTIPVVDHNELHANIERPRLITATLGRVALQFLAEQPDKYSNMEKFINLTERFDNLSRRMGKLALEAGMFAEHFDRQLFYMERHRDE